MALITDFAIFANIQYGGYTAQSTNSYGTSDLAGLFLGLVKIPFTENAEFDSTVPVTTGYNTYYKMQGWNPITQSYEDWHSMGTPLLDPPSGHVLENIGIIGSWIDR
jgi:hypothetical protein